MTALTAGSRDGEAPRAAPRTVTLPPDALVILVAPTGAGKSTFARKYFRSTEIVSSDRCRALVSDDEANQRATEPAFEVFHAIIRGRMQMGRLTVADATNLEAAPRLALNRVAREWGRPVVAFVLDVPHERAATQNRARRRRVPPHVIDLHYLRFGEALTALAREGFDAVYRLAPDAPLRIVRQSTTASEPPTVES